MATLTYVYADSSAVLGPLATYSEPHGYDLCDRHADRLTVPRGWDVIRLAMDLGDPGPSEDDLLALANAVREAALPPVRAEPTPPAMPAAGRDGRRRGHLRAVPTPDGP